MKDLPSSCIINWLPEKSSRKECNLYQAQRKSVQANVVIIAQVEIYYYLHFEVLHLIETQAEWFFFKSLY